MKRLLPALVVALSGGLLAAAEPVPVAHRGLFKHAPENTLPAFAAAADLRLGFELDVRRTKDGHLVCVHDETLKRTTGVDRLVAKEVQIERRGDALADDVDLLTRLLRRDHRAGQ